MTSKFEKLADTIHAYGSSRENADQVYEKAAQLICDLKNQVGDLNIKLLQAEAKIKQLEEKRVADSWKGSVDRQGGSFDDYELNGQERW